MNLEVGAKNVKVMSNILSWSFTYLPLQKLSICLGWPPEQLDCAHHMPQGLRKWFIEKTWKITLLVRTSNSEDHTYGKGARHSCYSYYTGCGSHECQGRSWGVDQRWHYWLRSRDGGRFGTVRASRSGEVVLYWWLTLPWLSNWMNILLNWIKPN